MPASASKRPAPSPIRLPEGIADAEGQVGYFASAAGGIDALDLATGKVLWQTHEAQRPLLLDGDHLLAQAGTKRNRLRVLRLACQNHGECDFESDPIVFPAWVVTGAAEGHSFDARWHLDKHHLVLDWQASAWYAGKACPTPEEAQAARKHASGIARIDLRTGQINVLPAEPKQTPPPPPLPEQLERKSLRWQKLLDDHWKVVALEEAEKGQERLVLYSWDRQKQSEQSFKELLRGKRLLLRTTLDERYLCLHEASPSPSPDEHVSLIRKKEPSWWWLFSAQTGDLVGRIPEEPGMNALVVMGKRVYYLVPGALQGSLSQSSLQQQTLRVLTLPKGKKLWEHPVAGKLIAPPPL